MYSAKEQIGNILFACESSHDKPKSKENLSLSS